MTTILVSVSVTMDSREMIAVSKAVRANASMEFATMGNVFVKKDGKATLVVIKSVKCLASWANVSKMKMAKINVCAWMDGKESSAN